MRVAVLHWYTTSVGGIHTTLETLRAAALRRGDTFHVLRCDPRMRWTPGVYSSRRRVAGGDTFITVDGEVPHHPVNWRDSAEFIRRNYDIVLLSYICPHPTKAYGTKPLFEPLLAELSRHVPVVGYVHDAYWKTYAEWGELAMAYVDRTICNQRAYGEPLKAAGYDVNIAYVPFEPFEECGRISRRNPKGVVWTPQWKSVKGILKFFAGVPELSRRGFSVDLYGNGIEYYKLRKLPGWRQTVGRDEFAPQYSGKGAATFHGCVPLERVSTALRTAGFMCDFQGHAAKYTAYLNGGYNHTMLEAMYFGAVPVVHANTVKSGIPQDFLLPVEDLRGYPCAISDYPLREYPRKRAREYVLDNHSPDKLYAQIFRGLRR